MFAIKHVFFKQLIAKHALEKGDYELAEKLSDDSEHVLRYVIKVMTFFIRVTKKVFVIVVQTKSIFVNA